MLRQLPLVLILSCALAMTACNDDNADLSQDVTLVEGDTSDSGTLDVPDPGDVTTDTTEADTEEDTAPGCASNADCAGGELCSDGACVPFCFSDDDCADEKPVCDDERNVCVGCLDDADCGDGESCEDFVCKSGCTTNAECAGGELCSDGACVPFCTDDDACADDETCDRGVCVPDDAGCTSADECAGGETCVGGLCVPIGGDCVTGASECTDNTNGRTCEDETWTPFACGEAEVCDSGMCVPALGEECDAPGERTCDEDAIVICGTDGTIVDTIACPGTCEDGECVDAVCSDADNFCVDERIIAVCDPAIDVFFQEECHPQLICAGGACVFEDGENVCGGDEVLPFLPGESCGDCGAYTCDAADGNALACDDPGLNACGGCGTIEVELGSECGDCGTWACGEDGSVVCDDPGFNGCGWCGDLDEELGSACGDCGTWVCQDGGFLTERGVRCEDPGANRCGGCAELATFPGDLCEDPNQVYVCDGGDDLRCQRNLTDGCFTAIECNLFASQFGIVDPLSLACDDEVGCYLKGNCSPDGIPTEYDPFGSACVGGSTCTVVPLVEWQLCTGCEVGNPDTCRNGEECQSILFGAFTICADPLFSLP